MVLFIFLLLVLASTLAIGWVMSHSLNRIGRVDLEKEQQSWVAPEEVQQSETAEAPSGETESAPELSWTRPEVKEKSPNIQNILLIGQDRRPGEGRARSDSMILCSFNTDTGKITLTSLMRDMYVPFPGDYIDNRINAAYPIGGMSFLDQLIEEDFGVHIDGNVEVDFDGFKQAMDLIAPLEITLKDNEAWFMNKGGGWTLRTGVNALNSEQLLFYSQMRYVGHSDWERTERQRKVLQAAFEKVRGLNVRELTELADAMLPNFTTDLTNPQILRYIYLLVTRHMSIGETHRLPVDGTYSEQSIRGMAVLVPDLEQNSAYLHAWIYGG